MLDPSVIQSKLEDEIFYINDKKQELELQQDKF